MDCSFSEKVSLFIDRALTADEAEQMKIHLAGCLECQRVEQDFIRLRQQIKSYAPKADPFAERQALWRILTSQRAPLWRRKIALPAPVFALVLVALLALGAWSVFVRESRRTPIDERGRNIPTESGTASPDSGKTDFSRYDRGDRAVIYKVRRSSAQ